MLHIATENRTDLKQADIRLQQARISKVQAGDSRKPSLRASAYAGQSFTGDYFTLGGDNHGRSRQAAAVVNFNVPFCFITAGS